MRSYHLSIILIVGQQLFFALDTIAIHRIGSDASLAQIGLLRSIGGIALVICLVPTSGWQIFYTRHPYLQAARALSTVGYTWVLIFSFTLIPLADATAIGYVSGLYVVLLAGPLLGETVSIRRYVAVLVGIAGAVMISKQGISSISWVHIVVLSGSMLNSMAIILTKLLRRDDHATTILLYVSLAQLLVFAPSTAEPWQITCSLWPWVVTLIMTGPLGMLCGIIALNYAEASALAPYSYIRLVITMLGATLLFDEQPSFSSVAGACIIIAACWYVGRIVPHQKDEEAESRLFFCRVLPRVKNDQIE